jgi:hypothetical protein
MVEQPKIEVEEELIPAKVTLDDEDRNDLVYDCHDLLTRVLARNNPQWLVKDGGKLLARIEETLSWHKIH